MAKNTHMTWYADTRRWRKCVKGKWFAVSCKQLGVPETKEASWRTANEWWERRQGLVGADERVARATAIGRLLKDFTTLDEDARKEAVEALLGAGAYTGLKSQAEAMLSTIEATKPDRSLSKQVLS